MATEAMSPVQARLRQKMLLELSKDDIRNKVRSPHARPAARSGWAVITYASVQVKLGPQAPARLRSLAIDTHDRSPAAGISKPRLVPYNPKSTVYYRSQVLVPCFTHHVCTMRRVLVHCHLCRRCLGLCAAAHSPGSMYGLWKPSH